MKFTMTFVCVMMTSLSYSQSELSSSGLPQTTTPGTTIPGSDISPRTLDELSRSYAGLTTSLQKKSATLLGQLQSKEAKLEGLLMQKDSTLARQVFSTSASAYQQLMTRLQTTVSNPVSSLRNYVPGIDSMQTAIRFLSNTGASLGTLNKLQGISKQLNQLQGSFQWAGEIQDFVTQREAELKNRLGQLGLGSQLLGINKSVFYYQQQLAQYKDIMNDQQQQQRLLSTVRNLPAFQSFWRKNSMLASLVPPSPYSGTLLAGTGLQTRAQVGNLIQQRLGTAMDDGGEHANSFLRQQAGGAQGQMDDLKQKLDNLKMSGASANSDMTMPDFEPNGQMHKSFLKRLEYGFNIQSTGATAWLPGITTIGLNVGYKLNNKATVGGGVCYLLGVGNGFNNIALTNQGAGLRTFVDIKTKGSLWITGGCEWNYMQQFTRLSDIRNLDIWQQSVLIGLTKKFNVGKKQGNIQVLYDLLADREVPQGQPLLVRFGYSL
jgi:hypothetical protein